MKKLIIASTLLSLVALPVLAQSPNSWNYGEYEPERRERHAQGGEILNNCVNTNKDLYCAETDNGTGIWQINDNQLYQNCDDLGCVQVEGESFIRSENGELIQVNPQKENKSNE